MTARELTPAEEWALMPDHLRRVVAAELAKELLTVKAGKYAERPIDPADLIVVATWLLSGECLDFWATVSPENVIEFPGVVP